MPSVIKSLLLGIVMVMLAGAGGSGGGAAGNGSSAPPTPTGFIPHELIVRLTPGSHIDSINVEHGTQTSASVPAHDLYLLKLPAKTSEQGLLNILATNQNVESVEFNISVGLTGGGTQPFFFHTTLDEYINQWMLGLLQPAEAQYYAGDATIIVAVLDTEVDDSHELLTGRVLDGGGSFLPAGAVAGDEQTSGSLAGHGTFTAGLIVTITPNAMLLPITVLDSDGTGDAFGAAAGILHAVDHGAKVINVSLSTSVDTQIMRYAVEQAMLSGALVVGCAGNKSQDEPAEFPAADPNALGVASTDSADVKSSFSNFGAHIDLSAPGSGIVSAYPASGGSSGYAMASGTSASAAIVSGAAALLATLDPEIDSVQLRNLITGTAVAIDQLNPAHEGLLGAGRLDVVEAMLGDQTPLSPGDVNGDGVVDIFDLLAVLAAWGTCDDCADCTADLDGNCSVDIFDLLIVLANWG